mgnify:FL=1
MLHQCACCGKKIDDQNDDWEALEVEHDFNRNWNYFHINCLDDLRTIERKFKELGTPEKSPLPKKVRGYRSSYAVQPLHSP